jgi:septum formation protein
VASRSFDIILASASVRRAKILRQMGVRYQIAKNMVDERYTRHESPQDYVLRLAREKAQQGLSIMGPDMPVLGADTIVNLDRKIFGKPKTLKEATIMLGELSGRKHFVYSAVAIANGTAIEQRLAVSEVTFRDLDYKERLDYCNTGEPYGKAGGYAIQGLGAIFVKHVSGSYSGVVGLPIYQTYELLKIFHVPVWKNK